MNASDTCDRMRDSFRTVLISSAISVTCSYTGSVKLPTLSE